MAEIQQTVQLQTMNTMALPAVADYYLQAHNADDIHRGLAFARERQLPLVVLGGGSNTLLLPHIPGLVLHIANRGIRLLAQNQQQARLEVAAGENWDDFLQYCLTQGWYGLENLAIIPGTVGAAPIQNIGAYGQEVADCIESVTVIDMHTGKYGLLDKSDCRFVYRDSLFRQETGRYLVTAVNFVLQREFTPNLSYQALAEHYAGRVVTAAQIRQAVISLRKSKLPDPATLANTGSFFKNPVIDAAHYQQLLADNPAMPAFRKAGEQYKIPAAWLIEQCGWRGKQLGPVGMYAHQALVMVNHGGACYEHVVALAQAIREDVKNRFAITLEVEPVLVGEGVAGL